MKIIGKKLLLSLLILSTFIFGAFNSSLKKQKFLSPEEAFTVSAVVEGESIKTQIVMADKIHIYKSSLSYTIIRPNKVTLTPILPKAHEFDGDMVYDKTLTVTIPIKSIESQVAGDYTLKISYQGCSDRGICYQPIGNEFIFKGKKLGVFAKISQMIKEGNSARIADILVSESSFFIILLFFIFGLLLALTPCIFPMIPILSSIIISQQGQGKPSASRAFFTSLVYVISMSLTYTVVGVVAGILGADIQTAMQDPIVLTVFAGVFVALAFSLFGYYEIALPSSWQSKLNSASDNAQNKGILGTAIMGLLSALIVGPCVAPPLGGAVLFISHTGDAFLGGLALFVMSMGMGMPLLLVGLGAGKFMPRPGGWMTSISQIFGVTMLALAIFMLGRILSTTTTMILWSLLFMGTSLYMGVFDSSSEKRGAKKLIQLLAMVFLIYGSLIFVGAMSGAKSILRPLKPFIQTGVSNTHTTATPLSHRGYSIARLQREVENSSLPVVVDFGKDSCTACIELEEITFPDEEVKKALKRFEFIKIDLTENSDEDKALLKKYELFGTPNIIFFDKKNNYLPEKSLTGFISPSVFTKHLESIVE
ncbi:MAG: protein-disulfide reductase DsbD [Sulfurovum sp.]